MSDSISSLLDGLNAEQRTAVETTSGPLLVLAGAGTGKTRVVTCRVAHLVATGVPAKAILAITFTKKAAEEMSARAKLILPPGKSFPTFCTFHSLGYRILREQGVRVGPNGSLNIVSAKQQSELIEQVLAVVDVDQRFDTWRAKRIISSIKNESASREDERSFDETTLFTEYEKRLKELGALDFDDLLSIPTQLLRESSELREFYQRRWKYILVDEYQDTNGVQHELLKQLTGPANNICVVGDDDQSIYRFRGATADRILRFSEEFPAARWITLDRSYRSHAEIIHVANRVIRHASHRFNKTLRSCCGFGGSVVTNTADCDEQEAQSIASEISIRKHRHDLSWDDVAVLYRVGSDAGLLRKALREKSIPHRCPASRYSKTGVTIMTLHRSKGLEYPVVFLPAVEEDTLPHYYSIKSGQAAIEEERRLLYVGVTRARRELVFSSSNERRGKPRQVSRFLTELTGA